ncbi:helix-turn-helix transcriptional regulator [Actinoplanes sp. Pm04-4]|uniref:Helix-turn-helix transcriptional regulator n=1 Tax=Paractinoplanes pyxinae TaxID=2997416 RepID=A0ABT4B6Q7_9ACTN|nr:helix-turn-helix transcriptional regulator [Actinoplanes pyxinae]MCY1142193.1 helix-turn-helix transcriptional regulator [Actinoplanes pyxinae]
MVVDEYVRGRPAAALAPFVAGYSGYRQRGVAPMRHLGLPSPYLTMILTMDEPLVMAAHPDPRQPPGSYDSLIGGLHLTPAVIVHEGRQSGVQVALRPLGCRALLGVPAAELVGLDVDASALLGSTVVAQLRERLCLAADWPSRFAVVDSVLRAHLRGDKSVKPEVAYAYGSIVSGQSVKSVAAEVGWSDRHLTNRFRAEVGLRPKETARVARFDRARRALHPGTLIGDVAAAHGYADQSHLVREFRALAGCTPSEWISEQFDFIQAVQLEPAHDGQHD